MGAPQYEQAGADVAGSGTLNTIPRWTGATTLGDSIITQNTGANAVGVGATVNTTWAAGWRALQVGQNAAIWAETAAIDGRFSQNVVWTGSAFNYLVNGAAMMYAQNANGHTWSYAGAGTAGNPISFTTGMILNTSGNVGMGTALPGATSHVLSPVAAAAIIASTQTTTYLDIRTSTSTSVGYVGTGGMVVGAAANDLALRAVPAGANVVVAGPGGALRATFGATSLDISPVSGYGLKLPTTPVNTDPNTLDAYRDGGTAGGGGVSFTATLKGGTTDPTTPVTVTGQYILIGKMMIVTVYFANVTTTGASGNVYVTTDIPAALRPATRGTAAVGLEVFTTGAGVGSFIDVRTDGTFYLLENFNNGGTAIGQHSAGTNRYLWFTATYIIP